METIGKRLGSERKKIGVTQGDFAEKLGITVQSQGNYERDVRSPSAEYLLSADSLGVDILYVLTGRRAGAPVNDLNSSEQALLSMYRNASQAIQAAVMGILATGALPNGNTVSVAGHGNKTAGGDLSNS